VSDDSNAIPTPAPWEPAISPAATELDRVLREILRASHSTKGSDLAEMFNAAARPAGLRLVVYVVDYEQVSLHALPDSDSHADSDAGAPTPDGRPPLITVDGSLGGRAFTMIAIQASAQSPNRLWIPILDGTERLGVLEAELDPRHDPDDPACATGVPRSPA